MFHVKRSAAGDRRIRRGEARFGTLRGAGVGAADREETGPEC